VLCGAYFTWLAHALTHARARACSRGRKMQASSTEQHTRHHVAGSSANVRKFIVFRTGDVEAAQKVLDSRHVPDTPQGHSELCTFKLESVGSSYKFYRTPGNTRKFTMGKDFGRDAFIAKVCESNLLGMHDWSVEVIHSYELASAAADRFLTLGDIHNCLTFTSASPWTGPLGRGSAAQLPAIPLSAPASDLSAWDAPAIGQPALVAPAASRVGAVAMHHSRASHQPSAASLVKATRANAIPLAAAPSPNEAVPGALEVGLAKRVCRPPRRLVEDVAATEEAASGKSERTPQLPAATVGLAPPKMVRASCSTRFLQENGLARVKATLSCSEGKLVLRLHVTGPTGPHELARPRG
jgi:hypothetical protein